MKFRKSNITSEPMQDSTEPISVIDPVEEIGKLKTDIHNVDERLSDIERMLLPVTRGAQVSVARRILALAACMDSHGQHNTADDLMAIATKVSNHSC